ncbi:MAG TPA: hypothetical protein VM688_07835 [Nocardioidaceae bacterium]|nr:hypothetical protein [Nocardioidaceae bacterium]
MHKVFFGKAAASVSGGDGSGKAHVEDDDFVLEPLAFNRVALLSGACQKSRTDRRPVHPGDGTEGAGVIDVVVSRCPLLCYLGGDHVSAFVEVRIDRGTGTWCVHPEMGRHCPPKGD